MRDWDTRISELKKNIEAARNRFVIPFLDSKYLEEQVVKDIKSKPTVNEKSETKEIDKNEETKDLKKLQIKIPNLFNLPKKNKSLRLMKR